MLTELTEQEILEGSLWTLDMSQSLLRMWCFIIAIFVYVGERLMVLGCFRFYKMYAFM